METVISTFLSANKKRKADVYSDEFHYIIRYKELVSEATYETTNTELFIKAESFLSRVEDKAEDYVLYC
jgi:hypothetical protein